MQNYLNILKGKANTPPLDPPQAGNSSAPPIIRDPQNATDMMIVKTI